MRLSRKIHLFRTKFNIIKNDLKRYRFRKIFTMMKMWSKGFSFEKYILYNLKENNAREYLSDYARAKTRYINPPYEPTLNNKIIFEKVFGQYIRVPKNYAYLNNGKIYPLQNDYLIDKIEGVYHLLKNVGALVVKPVGGGGGKGVGILKYSDNRLLLDNKEIDEVELVGYLQNINDYLVMEYIKQGQFPAQFSPQSSNTMRIIMMRNPYTDKPFIAGCAHRIGSSKSSGKDNFALGGFSAGIDIETGELSSAVTIPQKGDLLWFDKHPETNAQIKGMKIPNWEKIKTQLISVMEKVPYIKYIGWDIILTDEGIVAIEGNDHPEPRSVQVHYPLLKNKEVQAFYKYYNII